MSILTKRPQTELEAFKTWVAAKNQLTKKPAPMPGPQPSNVIAFKNNEAKPQPQNFFSKQHQPKQQPQPRQYQHGFFSIRLKPPTIANQPKAQVQEQSNRNLMLKPKFGCSVCGDMDHASVACNKQRPGPGRGR